MRSHATRAELKINKDKARIILEYRKLSLAVVACVLLGNLSESEAFKYERFFIAAIGRNPNGPLVNKTNGGEGWTGGRMTLKHKRTLRLVNTGAKRSPETCSLISEGVKAAGRHSQPSYDQQAKKVRDRLVPKEERNKISEIFSATIWITDGTTTKRVNNQTVIPTGWKQGRPMAWKGSDGRFTPN
jgi:hypothetical protein